MVLEGMVAPSPKQNTPEIVGTKKEETNAKPYAQSGELRPFM